MNLSRYETSNRALGSRMPSQHHRAAWTEPGHSQPLAAQLNGREEKKRMLTLSTISERNCLLQRPLNHPTAQWLFSVSCKLCYCTVSLHRTDGKGPYNQGMQISLALLKPSEKYQFPVPDAQSLMPVVNSGGELSSPP